MSLISRLYNAVQSWRRRAVGPKAARRAGVSMEQLDHRQLLSVNFTGNVATDFPASQSPGVVTIQDPGNGTVQHPVISDPALASLVKVSGFDINGISVSYDAAADTLSVGITQPGSQQAGQPGPVIAGDSDNNGNDGTVNPAVTALEGPGFKDVPDFGGSEFMGVFLDVKNQGFADVAAGYAINDPRSPKQYQVAAAVVNANPGATAPDFGTGQVQQPGTVYTEVPLAEGNVYKVNSPAHPNLEFNIDHFSQLYLSETGQTLNPQSVIGIGATAGSGDTPGISKAFFPEQKFTLAQATVPTVTTPPASPPVIVNFHARQHINTAHATEVRVNVLGSSGFDVSKIQPATVTFGGAHPIFSFDRFVNADAWPDATFVFRGTDIKLPAGPTTGTVTGQLADGTSFSSTVAVHNKNASFYSPNAIVNVANREVGREVRAGGTVVLPPNSPVATSGTMLRLKRQRDAVNSPNRQLVGSTLQTDYTPTRGGFVILSAPPATGNVQVLPASQVPQAVAASQSAPAAPTSPVVRIERATPAAHVPGRLRASMEGYVRRVGAFDLKSGVPLSQPAAASVPAIVHAAEVQTSVPHGPTRRIGGAVRAVHVRSQTPAGPLGAT